MKLLLALLMFQFFASTISYGQDSTASEYFKKAEYFFANADYALAVSYYDKTLALDINHVNSYLQRGFCKNILGKPTDAIEDFTQAIRLNPDNGWAYVSRGSAKNKIGEFQSALSDFNKALELDPKDQEAYNNRGFSKKQLGDHDGACSDWRTSKKLGNKEAPIIIKNNYCK